MEAMVDLFLGLERMSPGSTATTARAYRIAAQDRDIRTVVEFGCGSGISTMELARLSGASITAIDNCGPFLAQLSQKIDRAGLRQQIQVLNQSMDAAWPEGTNFDLVWCEGSVYSIGLRCALEKWRKLLSPGGRIAVSDLVWIDTNPDAEVRSYWENQGVTLCYADDIRESFVSHGYNVIEDFIFPNRDWQNYYGPLRERLPKWKPEHSSPENAGIIDQMFQEEMRVYDQFGSQYGYLFLIAERAG